MSKPHAIVATPTGHTGLLLVCKKCGKKLKGGYGPDGDETLARVLRREFRKTGNRSVRVLETKCLGLCPKAAVTVLPGHAPGALLAIPGGVDPARLAVTLLPPG